MELTNQKIAKRIVPKIVKCFFRETLSLKERKNLSLVLSENVLRYGYEDRKVITEVDNTEFSGIAEEFFRVLKESVYIANEVDGRNYYRIIDFAAFSKGGSLRQKVFDYLDMEIEIRRELREDMEEYNRNNPIMRRGINLHMHDDFY